MNQHRRKFDKWKIPSIIAPSVLILGLFAGGIIWVNSTSTDVEACIKVSDVNKTHIIDLEKAASRSRAFDDVITVKIDNLLEITNKIATRQERILDRLMDAYNTSEK